MSTRTVFDPREFGAIGDGLADDTPAIQQALDAAALCGGRASVSGGTFLVGALFIESGVEFHLADDAVLLAAFDDASYPAIATRIAGVEMTASAAVLNVIGATDVAITGTGLIDGRGAHWWDRFWGADGTGGLLADYSARGLRWAADYDVRRPRVILVQDSEDVLVQGLAIKRSPFWTVHLCYSRSIRVEDVRIDESFGPSTDGIDIDSCSAVVVAHCEISCADDNIVVKSGRDADGLRVGRVCEDIEIRDCLLGEGLGLALGSEVSGGIRNVRISDVEFDGTDFGIRVKSARARGGFIEDVVAERITMLDVSYPVSLQMNWFPLYNTISIPEDHQGPVPESWRVLTQPLPPDVAPTTVENITISDLTSTIGDDFTGPSFAFDVDALPDAALRGLRMRNIAISAREFGRMAGVERLELDGVRLSVSGPPPSSTDPAPRVRHHQWRAHHRPLPASARRFTPAG